METGTYYDIYYKTMLGDLIPAMLSVQYQSERGNQWVFVDYKGEKLYVSKDNDNYFIVETPN